MIRSDIPDVHVLELAARWMKHSDVGVVQALINEGVPERLAAVKVEHLSDRRLLDYGVSPYYAWPTEKGWQMLRVNCMHVYVTKGRTCARCFAPVGRQP